MKTLAFDEILLVRSRGTRDDRAVVAAIEGTARTLGVRLLTPEFPGPAAARRLVLSVGGDGTLLHALALSGGRFPLAGVNLGRLGYLADLSPEGLGEDLPRLLHGEGRPERRLLLAVDTGDASPPRLCLNDAVVAKSDGGRMIEIETWIDGRFVCRHRGDGLVVSTATGSTAYALSCGGPIVEPALAALVLVPISPHNLSDRPLVVGAAARVELRVPEAHRPRTILSCDGRNVDLPDGGTVAVTRAAHDVTLLHPPGYDPFAVLRTKLRWGTPPGGGTC